MDTVEIQKSGGSMNNPGKIGPATYADMSLAKLDTINWVAFGPLARTNMRNALIDAVNYGVTLTPPRFPPDSERIAALERELRVQIEMNRLAKGILEEKDRMIRVLKPQSEELARLRTTRDNRIDILEGLLQQQRDRIKALESDPTTEEGRFNIERQYEREFTNTSHLMGEIGHLKGMVELLKLQRDRYSKDYEEEKWKLRALQEEFDAYKKSRENDLSNNEALREAAKRVAEGKWDTYQPPYRGTVAVQNVDDYLQDPIKYDNR